MSSSTTSLLLKIASICTLLIVCFLGGLIPTKLKKLKNSETVLSIANCFSGGVFLGVGLMHMLPSSTISFYDHVPQYPVGEGVAALGFLFVFFLEKVILSGKEEGRLVATATAAGEKSAHYAEVIILPGTSYSAYHTEPHSPGESVESLHYDRPTEHEGEHEHLLLDKGHRHHHIPVNADRPYMSYILTIVLAAHSVIEGLVLGIETSSELREGVILLLAIASHKWIESFALGTSFVREKVSLRSWVKILLVYSMMSPLGIGLGMILEGEIKGTANDLVQATVKALACGTFLYVAICDVIQEEFEGFSRHVYVKFLAICVGFGIMAAIASLE